MNLSKPPAPKFTQSDGGKPMQLAFVSQGIDEREQPLLCRHERTGRPLGSKRFIRKLEKTDGRVLRRPKGGRPRKSRDN